VPRPWEAVAGELGTTAAHVLARVEALSGPEGIIREVVGLFEAAALGYQATLVAARVAGDRVDEAGARVAAHPGVSHCYGREGPLNLWFTLAVGPDSLLGLDQTVSVLAEQARAERMLSLPSLRRYKLQVHFGMAGGAPASPSAGPPARSEAPTQRQIRAVRALQQPLPLVREPFAPLAAAADMAPDDLLVQAADFLAGGWMRRYAAVLHHRRAGAAVNVLVAWQVPAGRADRFGAQAAELAAVSHCYLRETADDWPYNVYTMIHAADERRLQAALAEIAAAGGDYPRVLLPTRKEYRKARVRLFDPAFRRWEAVAVE
jgi:DNA-binding Lrp family transcriptional regulator